MREVNILISSAGRRAGLLGCLRDALAGLGLTGRIVAIDASADAPVAHLADAFWRVPRCTDNDFIPSVLEICKRERIAVVVPTIDTELPAYAGTKSAFARIGCQVAVSGPAAIDITSDKARTHTWLREEGFPAVRQAGPAEVLSDPRSWRFPLVVKPSGGSASVGVASVGSLEELRLRVSRDSSLIVQETASGTEHTVNVLVDGRGVCVCALPHRRLEVRAGEVSKAVTVKDEAMMSLSREVAERLPEAYGALNVQCFSDAGDLKVIEINARFGGGYPLAHRAGGVFTRWLLEDLLGMPSSASFDAWQDDLAMLRYDEAVFLPGRDIRHESYATAVSSV